MAKQRTRGQKVKSQGIYNFGSCSGRWFRSRLGRYCLFKLQTKTVQCQLGFEGAKSLNAFIHITPENKVKLAIARAEMGQGVHTALAMLTAEELEVDLDQIEVIHPQVESPYANVNLATHYERNSSSEGFHFMQKVAYILPYIATGGSTTIRDGYDHYRMMGASAKEMLLKAAAKKWSIDPELLTAQQGFITNNKTNEKLSYGELSVLAAEEKPNDKTCNQV